MWRDFFKTEFTLDDGCLYLKVVYLTGDIAFTPPRGDICAQKTSYDKIIRYCQKTGCTPRLCAVSEQRLEGIIELFPNAKVMTDRAWSDYIYASSDLISLAGRKYSGQRNHINKLRKLYGDWRFETIDAQNLREVRSFFEMFASEPPSPFPALDESNRKTLEVLDHFEQYRPLGGVLKTGGEVAGAALGEIVGDTLFVHIEKARTDIKGAYQMLVNQFAKAFAQGVTYINREEDDGVEGLRTSKLSYHPIRLLDKYVVELQ